MNDISFACLIFVSLTDVTRADAAQVAKPARERGVLPGTGRLGSLRHDAGPRNISNSLIL
jgi:hypothetical protein